VNKEDVLGMRSNSDTAKEWCLRAWHTNNRRSSQGMQRSIVVRTRFLSEWYCNSVLRMFYQVYLTTGSNKFECIFFKLVLCVAVLPGAIGLQ
jgi:hypothetical protein